MIAAGMGQREIVVELLNHGADINARESLGQSALGVAIEKNQTEVANILEKRGAICYQRPEFF